MQEDTRFASGRGPIPDPVQIRELRGTERARIRAGGPSGIRELRERFESILSELAELRAHKGDAERAELELRNELETTRAQLSNAVTQLGTARDQLTAARADADTARTDAVASTARAQRFEDRLTETMASAARAEHVEAELAQAIARAKRAGGILGRGRLRRSPSRSRWLFTARSSTGGRTPGDTGRCRFPVHTPAADPRPGARPPPSFSGN